MHTDWCLLPFTVRRLGRPVLTVGQQWSGNIQAEGSFHPKRLLTPAELTIHAAAAVARTMFTRVGVDRRSTDSDLYRMRISIRC